MTYLSGVGAILVIALRAGAGDHKDRPYAENT
jgi:hypothetical protein